MDFYGYSEKNTTQLCLVRRNLSKSENFPVLYDSVKADFIVNSLFCFWNVTLFFFYLAFGSADMCKSPSTKQISNLFNIIWLQIVGIIILYVVLEIL